MRGVALIGASTGAPRIHDKYLTAMPEDFDLPIVIIQHMPKGPFIDGMHRHLSAAIKQEVIMAQDGQTLRPRQVLLVEPGYHLRFDSSGQRVRIMKEAGENHFSPAMNIAFATAARVFGRRTFVAMTSGLHAQHDGLHGCRMVRAVGGKVLITDLATTPCPLMCMEVKRACAYDEEAPLGQVLQVIDRWTKGWDVRRYRRETSACGR